MKKAAIIRGSIGSIFAIYLLGSIAEAGCYAPFTVHDQINAADAICWGTVADIQYSSRGPNADVFLEALIKTRLTLKGRFPQYVKVVLARENVDDVVHLANYSPRLSIGEERIFFFSRLSDGSLAFTNGMFGAVPIARNNGTSSKSGILSFESRKYISEIFYFARRMGNQGSDVRDQSGSFNATSAGGSSDDIHILAAGDFIPTGNSGAGTRFVTPDRGEPIPYLVDLFDPNNSDDETSNLLPTGITREQALSAVSSALDAWANASSLQFKFEGLQRFGQDAEDESDANSMASCASN